MKCGNCGYKYSNSLTCPLCGHRIGKVSRCNVCGNTIHHGQSHCSNCGTPTIYYKKVDIDQSYHTNFEKKKNNNHTYNKSTIKNDNYKKIASEAKERLNDFSNMWGRKKDKDKGNNRVLQTIIGLVIALIPLGLSAYGFVAEQFNKIDQVELSQIPITGQMNNLTTLGNYSNGNFTFMNGNDIYLALDGQLYNTNKEYDNFDLVSDEYSYSFYVSDSKVYFDQYGTISLYDTNTNGITNLFDADKIIPVSDGCFIAQQYESEDVMGSLFVYDNGRRTTITTNEFNAFSYDYDNNLIYYATSSNVYSCDLNGQRVGTYGIGFYSDFYVNGSDLYYKSFDGINMYDLNLMKSKLIFEQEDILDFIVVSNGIVYSDIESELYYYNYDVITKLGDDVGSYNVIGDVIIYSSDGYYVADYGGNVAKLPDISGT